MSQRVHMLAKKSDKALKPWASNANKTSQMGTDPPWFEFSFFSLFYLFQLFLFLFNFFNLIIFHKNTKTI